MGILPELIIEGGMATLLTQATSGAENTAEVANAQIWSSPSYLQ